MFALCQRCTFFCKSNQTRLHLLIHAALRKFFGGIALARRNAREQFDAFVNRADGVNVKLVRADLKVTLVIKVFKDCKELLVLKEH